MTHGFILVHACACIFFSEVHTPPKLSTVINTPDGHKYHHDEQICLCLEPLRSACKFFFVFSNWYLKSNNFLCFRIKEQVNFIFLITYVFSRFGLLPQRMLAVTVVNILSLVLQTSGTRLLWATFIPEAAGKKVCSLFYSRPYFPPKGNAASKTGCATRNKGWSI